MEVITSHSIKSRGGFRHVPLRRCRVLLVDDFDDARDWLEALLRMAGHDVCTSSSGHDALARLDTWGRPDLCMLDIAMPVMTGVQLADELRRRFTPPPALVALTGFGLEVRHSLEVAGFDMQVIKPVANEHVLDLIQELCAREEARA